MEKGSGNNKTIITIDGDAGGRITAIIYIGVALIALLAFDISQGFYTNENIKELKKNIKLLDDTLLTKGHRGAENDTQTQNNHH